MAFVTDELYLKCTLKTFINAKGRIFETLNYNNMKWLKKLLGIKEIKWAHYDKKEEIMTVTYDDDTQDKYVGECTVWHTYPLMQRCATSTESQLCDIWSYIKKFGNTYPDAHRKSAGH